MRLRLRGLQLSGLGGIRLALVMAATLGAGLPIGVASASALPGPPSLSTGFVSDTLFFSDGQVNVWFPRMEQLDSSWVRIPASWSTIAPANPRPGFRAPNPGDPQYNWFALDRAVKEAAASNQHPLLMLDSPPSWALGPNAPPSASPGTWRPNPSAFGAFAHAVAERYSGGFPDPTGPRRTLPRVSHFQAWNEPNLPTWLAPEWTKTNHGWLPASPAIYRGLLNAAYSNIKSVQPRAYVLAAGLAPYGDPPGIGRMHPVEFLRELLCLHGANLRPVHCPDPGHFDAIDIHPYSATPTINAFNRDDVSVPDLDRLSRVLRVALRTHRALPAGPKPIWVTEIEWDSSPPNPDGIPLGRQARYLSRAFYEMWRQGVSHVFWYEVRDLGVSSTANFTGGGLFFSNGQPKPSAVAFRFPFVAINDGRGLITLWGRAPTAGYVTIEIARRKGWRRLVRLMTTREGVFYARRRIGLHVTVRARVGTVASYPWSTG